MGRGRGGEEGRGDIGGGKEEGEEGEEGEGR